MSSLLGSVQPSREAVSLAGFIIDSQDLQRRVLVETIESAQAGEILESGRTICPQNADQIRGPLGRFPRAVDLQSCPVGVAGILHTHVSTDQLRDPTHSLPDISNVLFGDVGASMVVGTQRSDVVMAPSNREAAIEVFQDALGLAVESSDELVAAIAEGHIPDPPEARSRVRQRLSPLFRSIPSPHQDIDVRVQKLGSEGTIPAHRPVMVACHSHTGVRMQSHGQHRSIGQCCDDIRSSLSAHDDAISRTAFKIANIDWTNVVATAAVSAVVSSYVSRHV